MRDQSRWTEMETCGIVTRLAETVTMPDGAISVIISDYGFNRGVTILVKDNDGWSTDSLHANDMHGFKRNLPYFEESMRTNRHSHIYGN